MKEIKAYIRDNMVDRVVSALASVGGVTSVAIVELRALGHAADDRNLTMVGMVKVEVVVPDHSEKQVVECIIRCARTGSGHPGDGHIFVSDVVGAARIADGSHEG